MKTASIIRSKSPIEIHIDFTTPNGSLQALQKRKQIGKG